MEYKYGTKFRPASIGTIPSDFTSITDIDRGKFLYGYYSEVTYDRELTEEEIYKYELMKLY